METQTLPMGARLVNIVGGEVAMVSLERGIKGRWVLGGDPMGSTRLSQGTKGWRAIHLQMWIMFINHCGLNKSPQKFKHLLGNLSKPVCQLWQI